VIRSKINLDGMEIVTLLAILFKNPNAFSLKITPPPTPSPAGRSRKIILSHQQITLLSDAW
jgi:hypothetical protein